MKPITQTFSRLLAGLALAALAGCSSVLFYPEAVVPITPARVQLAYRDVTLTTADGVRLQGWWLPAKPGVAVKGTVLQLHGNGGNLAWHLGGVYWLPAEGYQVLMVDYRGYGQSQGTPSLPAIYQDIDAALNWLDSAPEVQGTPRVLLGQSIGGALAIHYLARHPERQAQFAALVLDDTPASYRNVARTVLASSWLTWPLQVPLSYAVPDSDSAIYSAAQVTQLPKLVFQSLDDPIVPLANGIELYKALPPPRVLQLTRGGHVQTFTDPTWRQVLLAFLQNPTHFDGIRRLGEIPNYPQPARKP
ncbi:alpha/beta hydrolase [Pseudomonas typographi]|uniref:Alpha/beta hydrolase n=1 Tax=Pseudomonas typographi TaxID=2715964 RepID=A0ABR7YW72_9PSED|nr:alpha/beta hydrolase [Pseudomonas typographi]MBD1597452.1 alpha/beta hydrolase [Pseudomonas typographi]